MNRQEPASQSGRGRYSTDLWVVIGITIALNAAVFAPVVRDTPLRIPLGFVFVMLVPGYAFVSALYPKHSRTEDDLSRGGDRSAIERFVTRSGITFTERILLSVGFSILLVSAIGYLFNFTSFGVRLVPILLSTSGFVLVATFVAAIMRRRTPAEHRFRGPSTEWMDTIHSSWFRRGDRTNTVLNIFLVVAIGFFALSIGYAVVGQPSADPYSELYLTSDDGEMFTGQNVTSQLEPGTSQNIQIGVKNHEGQTMNYTVVVVQQTVEVQDNRAVVQSQTEIDRLQMTVEDDEEQLRPYTFTPTTSDGNSRIAWLLYTTSAPDTPSTESADYHVYLWVDDSVAGEASVTGDFVRTG